MKNTIENKMWTREFHLYVEETLPLLIRLKQQDNAVAFRETILSVLPGVKRYITLRLKNAIKRGAIPSGKYKVEDFLDELYIVAYDHIHEVKKEEGLYRWLFKKAMELMEDIIVEEDFNNAFFKNIDTYTKAEWEEMEEKFSTDGDGDFVMEEELDDLSYPKHDYTLKDVFVENIEEELIAKLNTERNKEIIQRDIERVVNSLPLPLQSVYELEAVQKFTPKEIAYIKNISIEDVKEYLAAAKTIIRISLENKYLGTPKN